MSSRSAFFAFAFLLAPLAGCEDEGPLAEDGPVEEVAEDVDDAVDEATE